MYKEIYKIVKISFNTFFSIQTKGLFLTIKNELTLNALDFGMRKNYRDTNLKRDGKDKKY